MNFILSIIGALFVLFIPGWLMTALVYPVWRCHVRRKWLGGGGLGGVAVRLTVSVLLSIAVTTVIVFLRLRFAFLDRQSLALALLGASNVLMILVLLRYAWHAYVHE